MESHFSFVLTSDAWIPQKPIEMKYFAAGYRKVMSSFLNNYYYGQEGLGVRVEISKHVWKAGKHYHCL